MGHPRNLVNDREVGKIIKDVEMYTEQVRSSLSDSQLIQLEGKSYIGSVSANYSK